MKYVCVLPYTIQEYFVDFMAACRIPHENIWLIDNTTAEKNIGIMKSHNMGIDFMKERGADWLIVLGSSIRFGKAGGLDFIKQLEAHPEMDVVHGVDLEAVEKGSKIFGWHFVAFSSRILNLVGRWDENFTPYGFDDIDMALRIRKAKPDVIWEGLPCDVADTRMSHSLNLVPEVVGEADSGPRIAYFVEKWGRHPGAYQLGDYAIPFNNPDYDLKFWPPAKNGGKWDD